MLVPIRPVGEGDFEACAREWTPEEPFPVIESPVLEAVRRHFDATCPDVRVAQRPGLVVSAGSAKTQALGTLFARATERDHVHVDSDDIGPALEATHHDFAAVVLLASDLPTRLELSHHSLRVGYMCARDFGSLSALIYKSLISDHGITDDVLVASHPLFRGAHLADATMIEDYRQLTTRRPALLIVRGQGRECACSTLDGMLCGRKVPLPKELPLIQSLRRTPCEKGDGCFRSDLGASELIPGSELNSIVTFLHSCSSGSVPHRAYSPNVSLALSVLEGPTSAVVGCVGLHLIQTSSGRILEDSLIAGRTLGEAVSRMNDATTPHRGMLSRFVLLGDPAQSVKITKRHPALAWQPARPDEQVVARLRQIDGEILPRLEGLRWLGIHVGIEKLEELYDRVMSLTHFLRASESGMSCDVTAEVGELEAAISHLQEDAIRDLAKRAYVGNWVYAWDSLPSFDEIRRQQVRCDSCGRDDATSVILQNVVRVGLRIAHQSCTQCGEVWWSSAVKGDEVAMRLAGQVDLNAQRGELVEVNRTLTITSESGVVAGSWATAFRGRQRFGLPAPTIGQIDVPRAGTNTLTSVVDLRNADIVRDTHTMPCLALVNGAFLASMVMLELD